MKELEKFANAIPSGAVLSLDIFDTAIGRDLAAPVHIFAAVQHKLIQRHGERRGRALFGNFPTERITAERESRIENGIPLAETSLDKIYSKLCKNNPSLAPFTEEIKEIEIQTEIEECHPIPEIKEIHDTALKKGVRVVFTSDMYLPLPAIQAMLEKCGYSNPLRIFLSSALQKTKESGSLWDFVKKQFPPETPIFHIGDNLRADFQRAQEHGIRSHHFTNYSEFRAKTYLGFTDAILPLSRVQAKQRKNSTRPPPATPSTAEIKNLAPALQRLAASHLPILFGSFVRWISEQARIHDAKTIHFLSRDGWILQRTWELLARNNYVSKEIQVRYAEISRRALWVPSLDKVDDAALSEFLLRGIERDRPVRVFLERIGLSIDKPVSAKIKKFFSSPDAIVKGFPWKSKPLKKLLQSLEPEIAAVAARERENALGYFRQIGLLPAREKTILVDIGWHASMQRKLLELLTEQDANARQNIVGLYAGLFREAFRNIYRAGYIQSMFVSPFTDSSEQSEIQTAIQLSETLHLAPHGSVSGYGKNNENQFVPRHVENPIEAKIYSDYIRPIQDIALQTLESSLANGEIQWEALTPQTYLETWRDIAIYPAPATAAAMAPLRFWDGIEHLGDGNPFIPASNPSTAAAASQCLNESATWNSGALAIWAKNKSIAKGDFHKIIKGTFRLQQNAREYLANLQHA